MGYTGIKDTQIKCETKLQAPDKFTFEATRTVGEATLGVKFGSNNFHCPDVGLRIVRGPFFGSLLGKSKLQEFTAHGCYEASKELSLAGTVTKGDVATQYSLGLAYAVSPATKLKAKVENHDSFHVGVKHEVAKGFTKLVGLKYSLKDGSWNWGCQLSIE